MPAPVVETPFGNVAVLCGDEGYVPEVARALGLEGADILAWPAFRPHPMLERIARTRADENRAYMAAAWPGGGMLISPDGGPIQVSPEGSGVAMTGSTLLALSRNKERAPGTNLVRGRKPGAYALGRER